MAIPSGEEFLHYKTLKRGPSKTNLEGDYKKRLMDPDQAAESAEALKGAALQVP
jgi:hypothetical protein